MLDKNPSPAAPVLVALSLVVGSLVATSGAVPSGQDEAAAIEAQRAALAAHPGDAAARVALKQLIDRPNPVSRDAYERIQAILRQYPWQGRAVLVRDGEPGTPLVVTGTVRDSRGNAVNGALLHVFQTDTDGFYTRAAVMDEPHARLFAYIRTGPDGRFEFRTIRPGGYPGRPDRQGEEWRIPQHIHFEVTADGHQERRFQMVFEDDPRMTPRWHDWAAKGRHPIVSLVRGNDGVPRAVCDIVLG